MDRTELENKLENFKKVCIEMQCVGDKAVLDIEESYPGMKPTSFIVNVHVKKQWLESQYSVNALKKLTQLLYDNTDEDALENILTLRMSSQDECHYFDNLKDGKTA